MFHVEDVNMGANGSCLQTLLWKPLFFPENIKEGTSGHRGNSSVQGAQKPITAPRMARGRGSSTY